MKKFFIVASLLLFSQQILETKTIILTSPLLRIADNAGIFHGPIVDILQTRIDIVNLINGVKEWNGAVMQVKVADTDHILTIYSRRPEIICGATFIAIAPDHELVEKITILQQQGAVTSYTSNMLNKTFYERQMNSTNDGIFSGSYAINPFNDELLPIYISDYAIECFDIRHSKTRLGIPAHNNKDLDFARNHNIEIKIVVGIQHHIQGKSDDLGPVCAAPIIDKDGSLKEAYLGEYNPCIVVNSGPLNDMSLKDATNHVMNHLATNNCGLAHTKVLQYTHNNQLHSIKDLVKIESAIYKNHAISPQINALKKDIKIALNYAQADFLEIVGKFVINLKNTRSLMIALVEESCALREKTNCYLLRWCQLKEHENEKEVFHRDIASLIELKNFCKDLVNFLEDFVHSCPKALENIRNQNS